MINQKKFIKYFPGNISVKFHLFRFFRRVAIRIKYKKQKKRNMLKNDTLLITNRYYGNEYWFRKYSQFNEFLLGMIEHGIYFGHNTTKVGVEMEWETGFIITFGGYREKILHEIYPKYKILLVGPYIEYVETDITYLKKLKEIIGNKIEVMTVFPYHSLIESKSIYDKEFLIKEVLRLKVKYSMNKVLICLHPNDFVHGYDKIYKQMGFDVITAGSDQIEFLPKLKAIFRVSSLTVSNSLGTHVGYSIYLNTPHIMLPMDLKSDNQIFREQVKCFLNVFSDNDRLEVNDNQIKLCDYFWGFSHVKKPEDLKLKLYEGNLFAKKYIKNK
jgi:hypothetical protein